MIVTENSRPDPLDTPPLPAMFNLFSDREPARLLSRKQPWAASRLCFIGARLTYDQLRFEAETIVPGPDAAEALFAAGLVDALVLEGAPNQLSGDWGTGFFDYGAGQEEAVALMAAAARHGLPRIAYLNGPAGRVPLFLPLARAADHVIVTSACARVALKAAGVAANLIPVPVQTALFHGFGHLAGGRAAAPPPLLSLDLWRASTDPELVGILQSLLPFGLRLCGVGEHVHPRHLEAFGPLAPHVEGNLTAGQLQAALTAHDVLVQVAQPDRDAGRDWQLAVAAAAARCAVVVLGPLPADDPRHGFAQIFDQPAAMRGFLSRLMMQPMQAEKVHQRGWRRAHRDHGAHHLVQAICAVAGLAGGRPLPTASVVTPTYRPERLKAVIETFRAQSWPERELIVMANTDTPQVWDEGLLDAARNEQIVFLSRDHAAGMAMNLGVGRASGDYVLRMDDDDDYGPAYVEDMMLAAAALRPDIMGKPARIFNFTDSGAFLYRDAGAFRPSVYLSREMRMPGAGQLAGFTQAVRRAIAHLVPFSIKAKAAADTGFRALAELRGDLLCACADVMNAAVERRDDPRSHTWNDAQINPEAARMKPMPMDVSTFLDPDALFPPRGQKEQPVPPPV